MSRQFTMEELSLRHFGGEDKQEIRVLMQRIGKGDKDAANRFLKKIDGLAKNHAMRIAQKVWGENVDLALAYDGLQEVLLRMVLLKPETKKYFNGAPDAWSCFNQDLQTYLWQHYDTIVRRTNDDQQQLNRLAAAVSDMPSVSVEGGSVVRLDAAQVEAATDLMKPAHPTPEKAYEKKRREETLKAAVGRLMPRHAAVVRARLDGMTLAEIAKQESEVHGGSPPTKQAIHQVEQDALTWLRQDPQVKNLGAEHKPSFGSR